jgi:hypothetical protein
MPSGSWSSQQFVINPEWTWGASGGFARTLRGVIIAHGVGLSVDLSKSAEMPFTSETPPIPIRVRCERASPRCSTFPARAIDSRIMG